MKKDNHISELQVAIAALACWLLPLGSDVQAAGRIVAANDDWTLSDAGFQEPSDPATFAQNVAAWFTGGQPGTFLAYSTHFGLTGSSLSNAMASAGHTWIVDTSTTLTLSNLLTYDGLFLGVTQADTNLLIQYVEAGGNVYVFSGATSEDTKWNGFLRHFGLEFSGVSTGVGDIPIDSTNPLFVGVDHLYQNNGSTVADLDPSDSRNQVLVTYEGIGLYAGWDGTTNQLPSLSIEFYAGITIVGNVGTTNRVEYVTSPGDTNWLTLTNIVLPSSPYLLFDPDSPRWARRFYRAVQLP